MSNSEIDIAAIVYGPVAEDIELRRMEGIATALLEPVPRKQLLQWGLATPDNSAMAVFSTFRYENEPEGMHAAVELVRPLSPHNTRSKLIVDRNNNFIFYANSNQNALLESESIARELVALNDVDPRQAILIAHMGYISCYQAKNIEISDEDKAIIPPLGPSVPSRPVGDMVREIVDPAKTVQQDIRVFVRDLDSTHQLAIGDYQFSGNGPRIFSVPLLSVDYVDLDDDQAHRYRLAQYGTTSYTKTSVNTPKLFVPPLKATTETSLAPRAADIEMLTRLLAETALECKIDLSSLDK